MPYYTLIAKVRLTLGSLHRNENCFHIQQKLLLNLFWFMTIFHMESCCLYLETTACCLPVSPTVYKWLSVQHQPLYPLPNGRQAVFSPEAGIGCNWYIQIFYYRFICLLLLLFHSTWYFIVYFYYTIKVLYLFGIYSIAWLSFMFSDIWLQSHKDHGFIK